MATAYLISCDKAATCDLPQVVQELSQENENLLCEIKELKYQLTDYEQKLKSSKDEKEKLQWEIAFCIASRQVKTETCKNDTFQFCPYCGHKLKEADN